MKKVTALFLAMLMCMALAVPALATGVGSGDSISSGDGKVTYTAKVQEPTINVTIPSKSQTVILNPYQIKVTESMSTVSGTKIGEAVGSGGSVDSQASILSTVLYLHNKSTAPLKMALTLEGDIPATSEVTFAGEKVDAEEKNKKVFIFVDVGESTDTAPNPAVALAKAEYSSSKVDKTQGVFKQGKVTLSEAGTLKVPSNVENGNYLPIQIGGNCTTTPTVGWKGTDVVNIFLTFTFQATNNSTT
ncbi:MAG: hypothetical protein IKN96_08495 [Oscillibacter sp.]|nr:hypothetical protein [Oscillibacter sp.]